MWKTPRRNGGNEVDNPVGAKTTIKRHKRDFVTIVEGSTIRRPTLSILGRGRFETGLSRLLMKCFTSGAHRQGLEECDPIEIL